MNHKLLLSVVFLFFIHFVFGQSYVLKRYDVKDGLISNDIEGIVLDQKGYLWVENGYTLSRYDGNSFVHFKSPEDYGDLVGNVQGIRLNSEGYIHYMALRGKVYFDTKSKKYKYVIADSSALKKYTESGEDTGAIRPCGTQDKDGNVWFKDGPKMIQMFDGESTRSFQIPGLQGRIGDYNALLDNNGNYGIQKDNYVYRFNGKDFDFTNIQIKGNYDHLFIDAKKRLWLFSTGKSEITIFDPGTSKLITLDISKYGKLSGGIIEFKNGNVLVACTEGVIISDGDLISLNCFAKNITNIVKIKNEKFVFFNRNECFVSDGTTLLPLNINDHFTSSDKINEIVSDREGNIWMSTSNGLIKASPSIISLHNLNLRTDSEKENVENINFVDSKGRVWFALENGRISPKSQNYCDWYLKDIDGKIKSINELMDRENSLVFAENDQGVWISDGDVVWLYSENQLEFIKRRTVNIDWPQNNSLFQDDKKRIWACFSTNEYLLLGKNSTKVFVFDKDTAKNIAGLFVEDMSHNIYILSNNNIFKFDEVKQDFTLFHSMKNESEYSVMSIDRLGQIWLYDFKDRLVVITKEGELVYKLNEIGINKEEYTVTGKVLIWQMKADIKGNLWLISTNGIFLLEPRQNAKPKLTHFTRADGLSVNSEDAAGIDFNGNLWMINKLGIDKLDINDYYHTSKFKIKHYTEANGVKVSGYNYLLKNAYTIDNIIVLSGSSGYYNIDVRAQIINKDEPKTYINTIGWNSSGSLNISGKIDVRNDVTDSTNHFELPYNFNPMIIDFIGICLTDGSKVKYKYMLEGLDNSWQEQTEHSVKYTSLAPGDYIFKLKACNNDEVWNKEPVSFSFTVLAPWYRTNWAYAGYVMGFIGIVVGFNGVRTKQLKLRQQELEKTVKEKTAEVITQKEFIEEKNKEITDSINYAQRIQRSILPPLIEVKSALTNSFILFKPKDIVSGDFYWFSEKGNKILIAAADCTGHGVPGAFMSTIGSEKLNEAVKDSSDVSEILNLVNRGMKKVLRQSEKANSTRDGMDIALCAFNKEMTQVEYAGANRPLWIVRKDIEEIEETKATKVAIGGFTEDEQVFTKHTIDLQKGDTVYVFSDGYADQFSPQDKKLMTRKFKEIILSIQNKSMEEQREYLGSFIENWKGNMEQTDDILVIGVRV